MILENTATNTIIFDEGDLILSFNKDEGYFLTMTIEEVSTKTARQIIFEVFEETEFRAAFAVRQDVTITQAVYTLHTTFPVADSVTFEIVHISDAKFTIVIDGEGESDALTEFLLNL